MNMPRLLVIQHEDACPPAWFGQWLTAAGLGLDVVAAHDGQPVPARLETHSGLLVLGGEMGAGDDTLHSWLKPTRALIADVVRSGQPFLGICLGHQLATVALGGEVVVNPLGPAAGLTPVTLTATGREDSLLGVVAEGAVAVQWNDDVASRLPPGAIRLATAPDGTPQAVRFADRAWGVQFHPEASPAIFRAWLPAEPLSSEPSTAGAAVPAPRDLSAAADAIEAAEQDLRVAWQPLAVRFAEVVHAFAAASMAGDDPLSASRD